MVVIFSERGGKWKNVVVLNYSKVMYAITTNKMQKVNHRITRITANQCCSLL